VRVLCATMTTAARAADVDQAVRCLVAAFAQDPITRFLHGSAPGYDDRLTQFFSLLMRARIALQMLVLVAGDDGGTHGAAMGYATTHPAWPGDLADAWDRFEQATPGLRDRMAVYDGIAAVHKPTRPHYYLGVIGADPRLHGRGSAGNCSTRAGICPHATRSLTAYTSRRRAQRTWDSTSMPDSR
jgi:hypothetical protein